MRMVCTHMRENIKLSFERRRKNDTEVIANSRVVGKAVERVIQERCCALRQDQTR